MSDIIINSPRDAAYASHVPVIRAWLAGRKWPIVEFGCGKFSTPVLAEHAKSLVCFERSREWQDAVKELVPVAEMRDVPSDLHDFHLAFACKVNSRHVVFVDGSPGQWRAHVVRTARLNRALLVFAHDWSENQVSYGYNELEPHPDYVKHVYRCINTRVRTVVFVRDDLPIAPPTSVHGHSREE